MSSNPAIASALAPTARPPPLDGGLPLVGHIPEFLRERGPLLKRLYRKHGPIFRMKLGPQSPVVMAGPELLAFATKDAGQVLRAGPPNARFVAELGGDNLLLGADLEPHFHRRKQLMPHFTPRAVMGVVPRLVEITHETASRWAVGQPIDVVDTMKRLVTRQSGLVLASRSADHLHEDIVTYIDRAVGAAMGGFLPLWTLKLPGYRRSKRRVQAFCAQLLAERKAMPRESRPGDFVDLLLDATEADGSVMSEGERAALMVLPFAAGLDTVAHTSAFLLWELVSNPALMERCTAEADALFPGGVFDASRLRGLETLTAAVTETLRRYPMADINQRVAAETFEFGGYRVEKGTRLMLATTVSHSLEEFFPDPMRFDPDRCLAPRNEHLKTGAFAAFGAGPHRCIGLKLGEVQVLVTVATLLHDVRFEVAKAGYTLKTSSFPALKPKGLRFRPQARKVAA
jgi:cytochrome P450